VNAVASNVWLRVRVPRKSHGGGGFGSEEEKGESAADKGPKKAARSNIRHTYHGALAVPVYGAASSDGEISTPPAQGSSAMKLVRLRCFGKPAFEIWGAALRR